MPQPPHSIQRAPPLACGNHTSSSADGSVNGKYDGRSRVRASGPNIALAKWSRVPLRWRHGDALVDDEALDLVEDRGVRGVELIGAVDPPRADDVDRRLRAWSSCAPGPARCACAAPARDRP